MPARYRLVAMTFALSMLLYVDRVAMSTAKGPVSQELGLTDTQFGWVLSAFVWLVTRTGWRPASRILGGAGVVWALVWWLWFRDRPEDHPGVADAERLLIVEGRGTRSAPSRTSHSSSVSPGCFRTCSVVGAVLNLAAAVLWLAARPDRPLADAA